MLMAESDDVPAKCPACGSADNQQRLGPIANLDAEVFECQACHWIYAWPKHDDSKSEGDGA